MTQRICLKLKVRKVHSGLRLERKLQGYILSPVKELKSLCGLRALLFNNMGEKQDYGSTLRGTLIFP